MQIYTIKYEQLYVSNNGSFLAQNKNFELVLTEHYKSAYLSANVVHLNIVKKRILELKELPDTKGNIIKISPKFLILWPMGEIFVESELIDELLSKNLKYLQ